MKIETALAGRDRVFVDSAPLIYLLERNSTYLNRVRYFFERTVTGQFVAVTSPVTLAECLVLPLRSGKTALSQLYKDVIVSGRNFDFVPIDAAIADRAAAIRSQHNLGLPDAFQAAIALETECDAFLTNDTQFGRVSELAVVLLNQLDP